jgi:hypothetical protein
VARCTSSGALWRQVKQTSAAPSTAKGALTLTQVEVYSNRANFNGGGIAVPIGHVTIYTSTLSANTAAGPDGGGALHANSGVRIEVNNSTIYSNTANRYGGGINNQGGLLTMTESEVYSNVATASGGNCQHHWWQHSADRRSRGPTIVQREAVHLRGGGILVEGLFAISGGDFYHNMANSAGGSLLIGAGSGILDNARIYSNTAQLGGGIINFYGQVKILNSAIQGNTSNGPGGGIGNDGGQLEVFTSTIGYNAAVGNGGAIWNQGDVWLDSVTVHTNTAGIGGGLFDAALATSVNAINSTIAHNTALTEGGALHNDSLVNLIHVTVASNRAPNAAGIQMGSSSQTVLSNTLLVNHTGGDLATSGVLAAAPISGSIVIATQVLSGTLPLGPLQDNGGDTWTMALPTRSAAIDAGADCPVSQSISAATCARRPLLRPRCLMKQSTPC